MLSLSAVLLFMLPALTVGGHEHQHDHDDHDHHHDHVKEEAEDNNFDFDNVNLWLNPALNLTALREQFDRDGVVVIENAFALQPAQLISEVLTDQLIESDWATSTRFGEQIEDVRLEEANKMLAAQYKQKARTARNDNIKYNRYIVSFAFDRTHTDEVYHDPSCPCRLCFLEKKIWTSPAMRSFLLAVTGKVYDLESMFASRYRAGDFLSQHTDKQGNKALAFVWHLTQQWSVEYGGLFLLLDPDDLSKVIRTFVPTFNTLILFNVFDHRTPHLVTEVAAGVEDSRISIGGWFEFGHQSAHLVEQEKTKSKSSGQGKKKEL